MTLDLQHPAEQLKRIVAGVTDDQLTGPTPCAGTPVSGLLGHLAALSVAFTDAAAKVVGPTTTTPPAAGEPLLPDDWSTVIPQRLDALVAAWREPAAWEGETTVGGVTMPAEEIGYVVNNELVLHAWDLSSATDQEFEVAEPNLDASWVMVFNTADEPEARAGLFGPRLPVAESAPLLDRVLAGAGRDPYWSPAD
ncbi:MAG: TIGR03086 family metal-binding protein [Microlunatus sp.]|nr:TIGR03086 family metal-binding protein [Microlunatus sp.]MDN5772059.1 TIGR03086 family metal-binding protein [Microlunatus sp.]